MSFVTIAAVALKVVAVLVMGVGVGMLVFALVAGVKMLRRRLPSRQG